MKKFQCDICKKAVRHSTELFGVLEEYAVEGVEHLCSECTGVFNEGISKIIDALKPAKVKWIKRVLRRMKGDS